MDEYGNLSTIYDAYFTGVEGDVDFYVSEAQRSRGQVLELGCGTGRITVPLAEAGFRVTGLDNSTQMLALARERVSALDKAVQRRIHLVQADMRSFQLGRRFGLIVAPYRAFMHLLTPQDQVQALLSIHAHLSRHGRLILNLFDPTEELVWDKSPATALRYDTEFVHPATGRRVVAWYTRRYDIVQQIIQQQMVFDELDEAGTVVQRSYLPLTLRYSHRYEIHYLLELCEFEVEALYGGFRREEYRGGEQLWIARSATST